MKERVKNAGEDLKKKTSGVFHDLDQVLMDRREVVRTGSLVLCPEIEKIIEVCDDGQDVDNNDKIEEICVNYISEMMNSNSNPMKDDLQWKTTSKY